MLPVTRVVAMLVVFVAQPPAAQAQRAPTTTQTVTGVAIDPTGAILPNAEVVLTTTAGSTVQQTTTDAAGNFRFDGVPQGRYEVHVGFEGFQPSTSRVTVGGRAPSPLRITLLLASLKQEVTVSNQAAEVSTGAATNSDAVTIDQAMLDSLPVFDQDLIGTVSRFLDAGALGNGGATIVVNGMEVSALRVSASAVQQIKINQDPYSAEYARPGRGRIEILTKPGSSQYHGETNLFFRDAALDAQNAFAFTKPDDRKHIVEGTLGGPLDRKSTRLNSSH